MVGCTTDKKNTGAGTCFTDMGKDMRVMIVPLSTSIADAATAKLEQTWVDIINDDADTRGYIFPTHFNAEDKSVEKQEAEGWAGKKQKVSNRKEIIDFTLDATDLALHQRLKTFDNIQGYGFFVFTENNGLKHTSSDGTKVEPFSLEQFNISDQTFAMDDISRTIITVAYGNKSKEWDTYEKGGYIELDFLALSVLNGIKDVTLAASTITSTTADIEVKETDTGIVLSTLVVGDWVLTESDGTPIVITSVTYNATKEKYELVYPTISGTNPLNLKNQPDMTTVDYESTGSVDLTI